MTVTALLNGQVASAISITDRGLSYGDGIFRTVLVQRGHPVAWPFHWTRLQHDCQRLGLTPPEDSLLLAECAELFKHADGVLKILLTRGAGGRGYTPPSDVQQTRLLLRYPEPNELPNKSLELGVCSLRLGRNPHLAGVKHLNRLEQVLARRECQTAGWQEALLLDTEGWVVSGTMSNLFIVKNNLLCTPVLDQAGVIGATRQRILSAAKKAGLLVQEKPLELGDCLAADEIFMCNSIKGLCPVTRLNSPQKNKELVVSNITRRVQELLRVAN